MRKNTIHNEVCLFRGFSTIAREKDINLHSTWQLETLAGSFPEIDKLMSDKKEASSDSYFLTPVYKLPDTWGKRPFFLRTYPGCLWDHDWCMRL